MRTTMLAGAMALAALPATFHQAGAQAPIPVGHIADYSGATSDVGVPYGRGVQDALAWVNANRRVAGRTMNVMTVETFSNME